MPHDALHIASTASLAASLPEIRRLCDQTFDEFTEHHWQHALGGHHVLLLEQGRIIAHASVVPRTITFDGQAFRAGYVEAVAVLPEFQGRGLGSRIMQAVTAHVDHHYEAGVLSTGSPEFYARFGWCVWRGPSVVRRGGVNHPSPDEDGGLMVRWTLAMAAVPNDAVIGCDERPGDAW